MYTAIGEQYYILLLCQTSLIIVGLLIELYIEIVLYLMSASFKVLKLV